MPSPFKITAVIAEAEPPQPPVHATAYVIGRDAAASGAEAHRRNPWTGRCQFSGTPYPCRARQSEKVHVVREPRMLLGLMVVLALLGVVLVAAVVSGLVR
ncbi:MAG: hypothetical protein ACRDQW_08250 [Haloechinothrix sp.]